MKVTTTFNRNRIEKSIISALARFQRGGILNSLQTGGDGVGIFWAAPPCWACRIKKRNE